MIAIDSFVYFPKDILAFIKSNTLHENARSGSLVQVVAHEDEIFASPNDTRYFSAFGFDMWWKLEFLDENNKLSSPIFINHQHFSDCGWGLRVSGLLALFLD